MKKIFGISFGAILAAIPMMAQATDVPNVPLEESGNALTTQSYVKGAYNELASYINTKQDKLSDAQMSAISSVSGLTSRVGDLETTVGDTTSGLVADVAALQSAVNDVDSGLATKASQSALDSVADDVEALQSTVGDANSGLVHDVTALQTSAANYGDIVTHSAAEFATSAQGSKADTALQSGDDISLLNNNAGYITSAALESYATQDDVEGAIESATVTTMVDVASEWGAVASSVAYTGTIAAQSAGE